MYFLLPPAENKIQPKTRMAFSLEKISFPEINFAREKVMTELVEISSSPNAIERLNVGKKATDEIHANCHIFSAPAAPAALVWNGVLAKAAGISQFSAKTLERVIIFSGLFGVVKAVDNIPLHRLGVKVKLPQCGDLAKFWRPHLLSVIEILAASKSSICRSNISSSKTCRKNYAEESSSYNSKSFAKPLLIDCRSTDYYRMWPLPKEALAVKVEAKRISKTGKIQVVSHNAKRARGALVGAIISTLEANTEPNAAANNVEDSVDTLVKYLDTFKGCVPGIDDYHLESVNNTEDTYTLRIIEFL